MPGRSYPEGSPGRVKMDIARPTHAKVRELADKLTKEQGRQVTFSEVIDILYEHWASDEWAAGR